MNKLTELYQKKFGRTPDSIRTLRSDGSDRKIYRVFAGEHTVIGILGSDYHENAAFLEFSKHFRKFGLRVPEIYIEDPDAGAYLEEDFGDVTLFDWMMTIREKHDFNEIIKNMYREVVEYLPKFQIEAGMSIDYSYCYCCSLAKTDRVYLSSRPWLQPKRSIRNTYLWGSERKSASFKKKDGESL